MKRQGWMIGALLCCCTAMANDAVPEAVDAPASVVDGVAMPGISPQVANAIPNAKPPRRSELELRPTNTESGAIVAKFGETQVVSIGRDRLNRIVTPFDQLRVKLAQDDATRAETEGSVLYVTTTLDEPLSLYLYDARAPLQALSLVLVPKATLPVDLTVRVDEASMRMGARLDERTEASDTASRTEPYVTAIMQLFKELASGRVPAGYGLRMTDEASPVSMPRCDMPGLQIEPAQIIEGHGMVTYVGRVTNVTFAPVDVRESGCAGEGILAVAAWPETRLQPRQSSELYIAVRRTDDRNSSFRPSVAGGGL